MKITEIFPQTTMLPFILSLCILNVHIQCIQYSSSAMILYPNLTRTDTKNSSSPITTVYPNRTRINTKNSSSPMTVYPNGTNGTTTKNSSSPMTVYPNGTNGTTTKNSSSPMTVYPNGTNRTTTNTKNSSSPMTVYPNGTMTNTSSFSGVFLLNSSSPPTWFNNNSTIQTHRYSLKLILFWGDSNPIYSCGFFCIETSSDSCYFAVMITGSKDVNISEQGAFPGLLWLANRDHPVRENARLEMTQDGDLILFDSDHTKVWSTNTANKSVSGMVITRQGNLVLYNHNSGIVWQSFDHPTDALVSGQRLYEGQRLTASASGSNWSSGSPYYTSLSSIGFAAFLKAETPLMYFLLGPEEPEENVTLSFETGRLRLDMGNKSLTYPISTTNLLGESHPEYIRLGLDGHLRIYRWASSDGWQMESDLVEKELDACQYPDSCGPFGVCREEQCTCPRTSGREEYFKRIDDQLPNRGCSRVKPLSCGESANEHDLVYFGNLSYFNMIDPDAADPRWNNLDGCKQACLQNCSCEAVFFKYDVNISDGNCYLTSHVRTIRAESLPPPYDFSSLAFIKVQIPYIAPSKNVTSRSKKQINLTATLGSSFGAVLFVSLLIALSIVIYRKKKIVEDRDEYFNPVLGMPMKFSYEDLRAATKDFNERLGRGGFGSVFKGMLPDGTRIAVKRLDSVGQGMKEFLAEVEIIGSIHHFNLVRLIGFCAEKAHRLLVYEYMSNGSLDNWIFNKDQSSTLNWQTKKNIILHIAKGLAYLHEDCRQRIVHLDIKPQNILLDDNFNAKVSDFGLSKLIDRDQSQILINMRGTPGYLAPEWQRSRITVKADIYSFGIVVLEIVCGRKNFDCFREESSAHLLGMLQKKAEEDRLSDLIDEANEDIQCHEEEVVKMIRIAAWCLQDDHTRRPLMSVVVKILEGVMEVEQNISYTFSNAMIVPPIEAAVLVSSAPPQASILSAPR